MLKYAICEIAGKLYKIEPNKPFQILLSSQVSNLEAAVLLAVDDKKVQIGKPYLKEKLKLKVLETFKGKKIRVAKFHAKANYRRVKGFRPKFVKVVLDNKVLT